MKSFLDEIDKNIKLFEVTNNEIIQFFHFPNDVYITFMNLLIKANPNYKNKCLEKGEKAIYMPNRVLINKDKNGKSYLSILGNDDSTVLIIINDSSNYDDYRSTVGRKITESDFIKALDEYQTNKLKESNISKRFIRDEIMPIDICEEMNFSKLISYYEYLNNAYFKQKKDIEVFDEPENVVGHYSKPGLGSTGRVNSVIDYSIRRDELLKHNPIFEIEFNGSKTNSKLDAYIYEKDGFILAVIEPQSGIGYQYALNLGPIDKNDKNLIKDMIKAALEAKEEIVLLDDAIMRKTHTSFETFKENLNIFLNNAKVTKKFHYDAEKAKSVYRV